MNYKTIIAILFLPCLMLGQKQEIAWTAEDSLLFWSDIMNTASEGKFRSLAAKQFESAVKNYISKNHNLPIDFKNKIAVLQNDNKTWIIATWQWQSEDNEWHYGGIYKSPSNQTITLQFESRNRSKINYETINANGWYGAMYFHQIPTINNDKEIIVFGFAQDAQGYKYKVIEPIKLSDNDIQFGNAIFSKTLENKEKDILSRIVLQYSSESGCSLNYDTESGEILYDHITLFPESIGANGKPLRIPDGTYEAYKKKNDQWDYIERVPNQILNTPPRSKPEKPHENVDILGRKKS